MTPADARASEIAGERGWFLTDGKGGGMEP